MGYVDIATDSTIQKIHDLLSDKKAKKYTLDKLKSLIEDNDGYYGFIEHCGILDPEQRIEYIGINRNWNPISINLDGNGGYSLGDWSDFPLLTLNKPYMVKADGTADYQLDENDYTKKLDGTDSDIFNTNYEGGAYAWIPKIYQQQYMIGNDRYVKYRFTPADGFEPIGFIDFNDEEMDGIWLPMFYGAETEDGNIIKSIAGLFPFYGIGMNKTLSEKVFNLCDRAVIYGGEIHFDLVDIALMLGKSSDIMSVFGNGNLSGYTGGQSEYGRIENTPISGGQFFGTLDGNHLNKMFHSVILNSNNAYIVTNSLIKVLAGKIRINRHYKKVYNADSVLNNTLPDEYSLTKLSGTITNYPHIYKYVDGFGAIPAEPFNGSDKTGGCAICIVNHNSAYWLTVGGATNNKGQAAGMRRFGLNNNGGQWNFTIANMILPPPNYTP